MYADDLLLTDQICDLIVLPTVSLKPLRNDFFHYEVIKENITNILISRSKKTIYLSSLPKILLEKISSSKAFAQSRLPEKKI